MISLAVDSDFGTDKLHTKSRYGFIIYLNGNPIIWYSEKQGTIQSAVFGAEFVEMKTEFKADRTLRCKLRMIGTFVEEIIVVTICRSFTTPRS